MMSAPMPTWRSRVSLSMPTDRPTITRIKVISTAMATMLMRERIGRCTRLATIILFMDGFPLSAISLLGRGDALDHCGFFSSADVAFESFFFFAAFDDFAGAGCCACALPPLAVAGRG